VLVGREEHLSLLAELVGRTLDGEGQVLVVEGEAGIGKSAVLGVLADRCREQGLLVLAGAGDELGATRPFAPLLDAIADAPGGEDARQTHHRLLRERDPRGAAFESGPGLQGLLTEELVAHVEDLCLAQPVALCIDDLHWADASTLACLLAVVRRTTDVPLLTILTMRGAPRGTELDVFLDGLEASSPPVRITHLPLEPLAPDAVTELSTRVLGGPPGPGLAGVLDGCAGNPLLVVELLASLADSELVAAAEGAVDLTVDPADLRLPTSLVDTVGHRMARLDGEMRALATVAALLQSRFTLRELASVSQRPASDLVPTVAALIEARLLTDDGTTLSYRHDLLRQAVVSALPDSVRADLHLQIAAALERVGAPTVRIAEQLALGAREGSGEAVPVLLAAAEEIVGQDPSGAESLLRRALEVCPANDPQRDLVMARLVDALTWSGRTNDARLTAEEVLSRPVTAEAEIGMRSGISRALRMVGRPHEAIPHQERLLDLYRQEGRSLAWPLAELAICQTFSLRFDRAREDASEAFRLGEQDGDVGAQIVGLAVRAFMQGVAGDSDDARALADRATALADGTPGGEGHRLHPELYRGLVLLIAGRLDEATIALERGRRLGEALGAAWAVPAYHLFTAIGAWARGAWDDLLAEVDAGLSSSRDIGSIVVEPMAHALAARVHLTRGDLDEAGAALDRGDRIVIEQGIVFGGEQLLTVRGLLLDTQGRSAEGLELLRVVWATAVGLEAGAVVAPMAAELVRVALAAGEADEARRVADELEALAARSPGASPARAGAARARGLLDEDLAALEQAVWTHQELGFRYDAALTRAEVGDLRSTAGDKEGAVVDWAAAAAELGELGATPAADRLRRRAGRRRAPARARFGWESLTPTELEVVEEVCAGRSNGQVAERLGVSRRTVEAHLRSIYPKLGVSTRLALAVAYQARDEAS
jgi:DNA-binding CsgD family transcriptional regulator